MSERDDQRGAPTFQKGDRVLYEKGVKSTLIGKRGVVEGPGADERLVWVHFPEMKSRYECYRGNLKKERYCYLCGLVRCETALCTDCHEDSALLGAVPPPQTSTEEEVREWARANNVTIFGCGERDVEC